VRIEDFQQGQGLSVVSASGALYAPAADTALLGELPWVLPLEHFSFSSLQMLELCPRQWKQRYILGIKEPPAQALVLGRATHGGIEFGLDTKMVTQTDPALDLVLSYYHDAVWPQLVDEMGGSGEILWDDKPDLVRDKGAQMVTAYHPHISRLEPEAVEYGFSLDVGAPIPVKGWIDLVQRNGRPSIDFKTAKARRSDVKPEWRVQARIYQLAVPRPVDFHVITKTVEPAVVTGLDAEGLLVPHSELIDQETKRRLRQALDDANRYYATYGPDEEWPARGIHHDWRCSWCAYQKDCPAWVS